MLSAVQKARVLYAYDATSGDELTLRVGETIVIIEKELEDPGWWKGDLNGKIGVFPDNFVELIPVSEEVSHPVIIHPV